jgi:UDP-glucose 4-epimerase
MEFSENLLKDRTIVISGIGGFIGYNLAKTILQKSKNTRIIGIDNFSYVEKKWIGDIIDKIELIEDDVAKWETWKNIKSIDEIDYIFHFGSPSSIVLFKGNPEKSYLETVLSLWNAFKFGKEKNVKKIIYPSSGSIYGGNEKPHKESIYPKPRNLYAAAKMACEGIAQIYGQYIKSVGLRIFAGYGSGEERKGEFASVICLFIKDMLEEKSPILYGDGSQERDFVYIDDVINAIIRSAEIDFSGIINVGTGVPTSFSKVIQLIQKTIDNKVEPIYIKKESGYVESLAADTTLMKKLLNVESISIEDGIERFIKYLKKD